MDVGQLQAGRDSRGTTCEGDRNAGPEREARNEVIGSAHGVQFPACTHGADTPA